MPGLGDLTMLEPVYLQHALVRICQLSRNSSRLVTRSMSQRYSVPGYQQTWFTNKWFQFDVSVYHIINLEELGTDGK
jgi:hypothetical protein